MSETKNPLNVAILAVDGFEQVELVDPRQAIRNAGGRAVIVSAAKGTIQGMNHDEKGDSFEVDLTFTEAEAELDKFDAVVLPGGVVNADEIRMHPKAQAIVKGFAAAGKPIAVICHGAWLLISAGLVKGRQITSFPSLKDDLVNAGARWTDAEVVEDGNLISSRKPDDLPAFNKALLKQLGQLGGT